MGRHANPPLRYEELTETAGIPLTREGAAMMYTRYRVGADLARGQRVLEIGCGSGVGLGLIARSARCVTGADFSPVLLHRARRHYGERVPLVRLSAESLPFESDAFDLVLFLEASYYVRDTDAAFREIARVLAGGGRALFVNANPERPDFITSPHSVHYHTADEFRQALARLGLEVTVEAAFPVVAEYAAGRAGLAKPILGLARQALETLGLAPRTLRGRARLKRLVYGRMIDVPAELSDGFAPVAERRAVPTGPARDHKVLYVHAVKQ